MPTLLDRRSWKITMYFGDHNPPHFHIVTKNGTGSADRDRDIDGDGGRSGEARVGRSSRMGRKTPDISLGKVA